MKVTNTLGYIIALLMYMLLIAFFLRSFITDQIVLGAWDWGFPLTTFQAQSLIKQSLSIINDGFSMGTVDNQAPFTFYFRIISFMFVWLFGVHGSKWLIYFVIISSSFAMYNLLRRIGVATSIAWLFGLLFGCNPYIYSRIVAGHFDTLVSIPFVVMYTEFLIIICSKHFTQYKIIPFGIILFALSGLSPLMLGVSSIITFFYFIRSLYKIPLLSGLLWWFLLMIGIIGTQWHWIWPMYTSSRTSSAYFRNDTTVDEEIGVRDGKVYGSARPVTWVAMWYNDPGLHTEYIYPISYRILWFIAQIVFLLTSVLLLIRRSSEKVKFYFITAVISLLITSGAGNPIGEYFMSNILKHIPPVYFVFSNTFRFFIIHILFSSIFYALASNYIYTRFSSKRVITSLIAILILLRIQPVLNNQLFVPQNKTSQSLSLRIINNDNMLQDSLAHTVMSRHDSRDALLPPYQLAYTITDSINLGNQLITSGNSDFFNGTAAMNPYHIFVTGELAKPNNNFKQVGKLLSLASVKQIFVQPYKAFYTYVDYGLFPSAEQSETLYKSGEWLVHNLENQGDVVSKTPSQTLGMRVYENLSYLPRVVLPQQANLILGNFSILTLLAKKSLFNDFSSMAYVYADFVRRENLPLFDNIIMFNNNLYPLIKLFISSNNRVVPYGKHTKLLRDYVFKSFDHTYITDYRMPYVLEKGVYKITNNKNIPVVLIGKIIHASDKLILQNKTICNKSCDGTFEFPIERNSQITLEVSGEFASIDSLYMITEDEYKQVQKSVNEYLQSRNVFSFNKNGEFQQKLNFGQVNNLSTKSVTYSFTRNYPYSYTVDISPSTKYIYVSQAYDPKWVIEGHENLLSLPSGANGILFFLDETVPKRVHIIYNTQISLDNAYKIILGMWILLGLVFTLYLTHYGIKTYFNYRLRRSNRI